MIPIGARTYHINEMKFRCTLFEYIQKELSGAERNETATGQTSLLWVRTDNLGQDSFTRSVYISTNFLSALIEGSHLSGQS